jgi:PX domain
MAQIPLDLVANSDFDKISMKVDLAEERDDKVKYRIRLMIDLTEYITYRDYKQFKNFHCSLKFSFPRFDFSEFPSKFVLLNKKEHRRKGFDKFLSNIKKIGLSLPEVPKKNLKRLLLEFIAEEKMNLSLDSIYCKDEIVYKSQVKPSDGFFTGFIDIRLEEEDWITYYGSLINSDLYLFPNDSSKYFITVINCSGTDILKSDLEKVIEIHHQFEKKPILIRSNKWEEWKNHLVIVSNFANSSKSHKIKSNGRLIVKIYSGQNIKLIKPAVSLVKPHAFVRITVGGFRYETSILPQEYLINWNQTFIL